MIRSLDHVILAVADLEAATAAYAALLGRRPSWRGRHPALGTRNALFRLDNTYVELLACDGRASGPLADLLRGVLGQRAERPFGLALAVDDVDEAVRMVRARGLRSSDPAAGAGVDESSGRERTWRGGIVEPGSSRGLRLLFIQHTSPPHCLPPAPLDTDERVACNGVDHVVIFTADLDASAKLWSTVLGAREEWRRDFPERNTRNLGLDLGGITVELITRTDTPGKPEADTFWGVAYTVGDSGLAVERLRRSGIEADEPRSGLAPGTRVATVRWRRTATLLIEHTPG